MPEKSIAIIGSESLLGRELRDALAGTPLRHRVKLLGVKSEKSVLSASDDEAVPITPLAEETLHGVPVAILAGGAAAAREAYKILSGFDPMPAVIDLSFALEDQPEARLRAPLVEPRGFQAPAGGIHVIAQPAAIALALFLGRLEAAAAVRRSVIQVFEPASERGHRGLQELQKQTVGLLSFQKLPQDVYDVQVSFNMLPRFGTEAREPLEDFEARIERHLATLLALAGSSPMPSLRLIQAPVFHGYSISAWVEFADSPHVKAIGEKLGGAQIEVRTREEEPASNVGVVGQSGITVSIDPDRNNGHACWFWIVADNLRVTADNAVMTAQALLEAGR